MKRETSDAIQKYLTSPRLDTRPFAIHYPAICYTRRKRSLWRKLARHVLQDCFDMLYNEAFLRMIWPCPLPPARKRDERLLGTVFSESERRKAIVSSVI